MKTQKVIVLITIIIIIIIIPTKAAEQSATLSQDQWDVLL